MNRTMATAARTLTIGMAATLAFNAANASPDDVSNDTSMRNAIRTYTVRFADLNLSTYEGAKRLYTRLGYAAKVVCQPLDGAHTWLLDSYPVCVNKAISDAVASVNRPLLSEYHQLRTKSDKTRSVELAKAN
jgi:UrcA family protein